jgi:DNA-binding MarR family transcriptional regulator/GNAT superfamily N-acetyltransferase
MAASARPLADPDNPVYAVRCFNRFYTRQIGVLHEHLLHSQFSLTEVRVLYELAHCANVTAVELRDELGLDRGYLSRMLQNFAKHGWIKTTPSRVDRRRIFVSLTSRGRKIFAPLDRRSSEEVASMLARLSPSQQRTLLAAMADIENILTSPRGATELSPALQRWESMQGTEAPEGRHNALLTLRPHRPGDMGWVVQRHGELYWHEYKYDERFEALVAEIVVHFIQNFDPQRERCWIAEKDGERVGTILLVRKSKTVAKLRLLLVEPEARGLGVGKHLVSECVTFASHAGYKKIVLWTQSELHAARHLYEQAGFKRMAQRPHQSWGRKDLVSETWSLTL